MNLGETIYRLRTERHMSQGDLADALDVSRQSVSKWETGNAVPELDKLVKMSQLFEVTLDELVGQVSPKQPLSPTVSDKSRLSFPSRKIAGTLLLCAAFLTFLLITVFGQFQEAVILSLPFALCGAACFAFQKHTGLWCAWIVYVLISIFGVRVISENILFIGNLEHFLFLQLPILIYTVAEFRVLNLKLQKKHKLWLCFGWLLWVSGWGLYFYDAANSAWFYSPWIYTTHFLLLALLATLTYHLLPQRR